MCFVSPGVSVIRRMGSFVEAYLGTVYTITAAYKHKRHFTRKVSTPRYKPYCALFRPGQCNQAMCYFCRSLGQPSTESEILFRPSAHVLGNSCKVHDAKRQVMRFQLTFCRSIDTSDLTYNRSSSLQRSAKRQMSRTRLSLVMLQWIVCLSRSLTY